MLAISMKSQHPHLHNTDPSSSDSTSLSPPNTSSTAVAQTVKPPQSSTTSSTMLAVATPSLPPVPILQGNTAAKRPKLSLQTSCLPVAFGNSTTALSLNHSANCSPSPTVRNTFRNAYDAYRRTSSPAPTNRNEFSSREPKSSKQEISAAHQPRHSHDELPYQLPLGIRGILRNSPHVASTLRRASLSAPAANGSGNGRRALFPAQKRVNYRYPLDEEIKTVHFVARHSDLTSSDSSTYSSSSGEEELKSDNSDSSSSASDEDAAASKEVRTSPGKRKKHARQIRAAGLRDRAPRADDDPETPQTPVRRRRKRQRQWRWTLGPIKDGHVDLAPGGFAAPEKKEAHASLGIDGEKCPFGSPLTVAIQSRPRASPVSATSE
ncbi:predicted protein [Uncinocarpus reesii 1704]|uniref:Uncharacterized protein n=1 Tax=Uncinocarpus reesii (strain UAMH 1704) TaxID=336963 RepID=C4JRK1_UNCRE|nr:uncharacterized protein UREG_05090 [Uncinocarpus reesii 1704]EEP80248.1 predicted protein [Uncinocarpus reesii 1704]